MSWLGIARLFSPKKQDEQSEDPSPATSPLAKRHPNRVQKPRGKKGRTPTRRGKPGVPSKLRDELLAEIDGGNGQSAKSVRFAEMMEVLDYEKENDMDDEDESTEFVSQPPLIAPMSPESDVNDDDEENLVSATPNDDEAAYENDEADAGPADVYDLSESLNGDEAEDQEEDAEHFSFTKLLDYRWDENNIEIQVQWHGEDSTWEPESNLHEDAPDALFAFWKSKGGRPTNPYDPDMFDIFAIRDHNKNRQKVLVEWTGYPPSENTWVSRRVMRETAPDVVAEYFRGVNKQRKN